MSNIPVCHADFGNSKIDDVYLFVMVLSRSLDSTILDHKSPFYLELRNLCDMALDNLPDSFITSFGE